MQQQLGESIASAVQDSLATFKQQVKTEMVNLENRCYLKTLSESDVHEKYNRRDNVKIFNIKMDEGKTHEEYNETIDKVLEVIARVEFLVEASDISIAHRLPGKRNPIIVKFNRRLTKLNLLKKKKKLEEVDDTNYKSVVEDITRPRLNFLNIMKFNNRIKTAWVREDVLHHIWNKEAEVYKIFGLYEGGSVLNYPSLTFLSVSMVFFPQTITHKSLEPLHKPLPSRDKPSTSQPNQIISVLHLNIRSIRNKLPELESFIFGLESLPKVICLTETHLDDNDDTYNFRLPGYSYIEVKNRKVEG